MFYRYPAAAMKENWLHEFLVETIETIHQNATPGKRLLKWRDHLPKERQKTLKNYTALGKHIRNYEKAVRKLDDTTKTKVLACLKAQNQIEGLLGNTSDCDQAKDLPVAIRKPIVELFGCAFGMLTPLGIRDRQYEIIWEASPDKVCPFCFCEDLDVPKTPRYACTESGKQIREALDHYLSRDAYPFAAANLQNLAPMGGRCNLYKHNTDIIRKKGGGQMRRAFFPYSGDGVGLSLKKSKLFLGKDKVTPDWVIEFTPSSQEAETWDEVFVLSKRLRRNVLDRGYKRWIGAFCQWYVTKHKKTNPTNAEIVTALEEHYADLELLQALNGREHFRGLVLLMLQHHCSRGNARLLRYIKAAIQVAVPPPKQPLTKTKKCPTSNSSN